MPHTPIKFTRAEAMARGPHHHHLLIHGLILTPASSTYIHKYMKKA